MELFNHLNETSSSEEQSTSSEEEEALLLAGEEEEAEIFSRGGESKVNRQSRIHGHEATLKDTIGNAREKKKRIGKGNLKPQ